jgi:signal transduction histidine kinase
LDRFFDDLQVCVETGDPTRLDPVLEDWVAARTQTELNDRETSLTPVLEQFLLQAFETARQELPAEEALSLTEALLPIYTYAFESSARKEIYLRIEHVSGELGEARQTLERLEKSKSDFISVAAHELKTPLTLIEGYAAMIRDSSDGVGEQEVMVYLNGIDRGARRLREIVDNMIDVSMIDNNLLSLNFQPVWINQLFRILEIEFAQVVFDRRLKLEIQDFPGSADRFFADAERLLQALRNVLSNAIKYTPDGGSIQVSGRRLSGFIEVTVSDTGIGVDPENYSIIFEKFGRLGSVSLHSSGKTKFKGGGPGLGLPITKGIVEAHGGAIWVESDGHNEATCPGATFHLLLPFRVEPPDERIARLFGEG